MNKIGLIFLAQNLVKEFGKINIKLDYSIESLKLIEDYISKNSSGTKFKKNSFFAEDTDSKAFALGAYLGEVIRRNSLGVRWNNDNSESPIEIIQETPNGSKALTINKAFKRIYHGEEDSIHHFAIIMLKDLLKYEESIPDDFYDIEDIKINKFGNSPIAIYSRAITENNGIVNHIYYEEGQWYFSSADENESNSNEDNYEYKFLDEIKQEHPEFASMLKAKDKLRIVRQDDGTYRSQKQHKALFYDSHTIPSYQGDMKLNFVQWTKFNAGKVLKSFLALILGTVLMIKIHWIFILVFIGALLYNIWYWFMSFNRFKGGDVNPGKVISINPTLVAVASDMRKFAGDYPILKIIETKLPKEDRVIDKIIPTVALYNDNPHGYPFWAEFHPVPVIQGIKDRNHIDSILKNFSKSSLQTLDDYILKTKSKEVGIYKVDEENSNWSNFKHVDISKGVSMEKPIEEEKETEA
jgi:hypothetical protein